jgi:CheY-like chemotaxis protein
MAVAEAGRMTTLLLVEPSPDRQRSLVALLGTRGYRVLTAADGAAAVELLADPRRPTVIVLDVSEPIAAGQRLVSALDEPPLRDLPVVVLSTVAGTNRELPAHTVAVLIGRPVRGEVLLEIVDKVCRPPRARLESQAG